MKTESAIIIGENDAIVRTVSNWLIRFKSQLYQGHELACLYNWNYTVSSFCKFIEHIEDNVNELAKTTNYNDNNIFLHNKHHTSPVTSILRITYM